MRTPVARFLAVLVAATISFAVAQADGFRLAFVDTQVLISAHPAQADIADLGAALDAELQELLAQRQALITKQASDGLTAEEEELLQALTVTIQTRQNTGLEEIRNAAAPAEQAANDIIREIAARDGYDLVLDIGAAAGLVVFAAEDVPDITQEAVTLMQERFPAQ